MEKMYEIVKIKQVVKEAELVSVDVIRSPDDAADISRNYIGDEDREVFFVMCLNTKNGVVAVHRCHIGSINASVVHPREVFKAAILNNAASIIVAHNHPSGQPSPSQEDIHITRRLVDAGKMLGIEVLDHVIIGGGTKSFISLREKGYI